MFERREDVKVVLAQRKSSKKRKDKKRMGWKGNTKATMMMMMGKDNSEMTADREAQNWN